mgnify:FL=1
MTDRPNKNFEQRLIESFGPKFRIDVNSTNMGEKGTNVFLMYAVTDDNTRQFSALSESGRFMLSNEKDIEIVAGSKNNPGDVGIDIKTMKGNIEITCQGDGNVLIKGSNIVIQSAEDISLKSGRNISLSAAQTINLSANRVQASGYSGNIMKAIGHVTGGVGSFVQRVFNKTNVGGDLL